MSPPLAGTRANVRSLEALQRLRPALFRFETDLNGVFAMLHQELDRTLEWLDHECPHVWQQRIRTCFDRVAATRTELTRKQMITVAGHRPDCIDEKKAYREAKRNLEHAQGMLQVVRNWSIKAHRAADEYNCQLGRIEQVMTSDIPRMRALLDRIIAAIESYVESNVPLVESHLHLAVTAQSSTEQTPSIDEESRNIPAQGEQQP